MGRPSFTIGMEEEYLLVDCQTRDVVSDPPRAIFEDCAALTDGGEHVLPELLRAQIEVDTRVCRRVVEAGQELARLRRTVAEVASHYGLAPIAASTHPFAQWQAQQPTEKERYRILSQDMQSLARRVLVCGMHVHVGIDDDELRIDLLRQLSRFLPLLLALSTSSPFWEGQKTGLMSYRLPVFDTFPRTGLPEAFANYADYRRQLGVLVDSGVVPDPTMIWWDLRPSERFPTLEMRITDMCTNLADAVGVAALTQCVLHWLYRRHRCDPGRGNFPRFLIDQNRWRAIRYGLDEGLLDFDTDKLVPVVDQLDGLLNAVREDAEELGCLSELEHLREIPKRGTSAHRQLRVHSQALADGASPEEALRAVVDMLLEQTLEGI